MKQNVWFGRLRSAANAHDWLKVVILLEEIDTFHEPHLVEMSHNYVTTMFLKGGDVVQEGWMTRSPHPRLDPKRVQIDGRDIGQTPLACVMSLAGTSFRKAEEFGELHRVLYDRSRMMWITVGQIPWHAFIGWLCARLCHVAREITSEVSLGSIASGVFWIIGILQRFADAYDGTPSAMPLFYEGFTTHQTQQPSNALRDLELILSLGSRDHGVGPEGSEGVPETIMAQLADFCIPLILPEGMKVSDAHIQATFLTQLSRVAVFFEGVYDFPDLETWASYFEAPSNDQEVS